MEDNNSTEPQEINKFWRVKTNADVEKIFADADLLWEAADGYFTHCMSNPLSKPNKKNLEVHTFSVQGFCLYLGCHTENFENAKFNLTNSRQALSEADQKLKSVVLRIEDAIYQQKFIYAAAGLLKTPIISKDLRLGEKKEKRFPTFKFVD